MLLGRHIVRTYIVGCRVESVRRSHRLDRCNLIGSYIGNSSVAAIMASHCFITLTSRIDAFNIRYPLLFL